MEQQNNPWMNFHLNASEYADRIIFAQNEAPIVPGDERHSRWLKHYDIRMSVLQDQFTNYQLRNHS